MADSKLTKQDFDAMREQYAKYPRAKVIQRSIMQNGINNTAKDNTVKGKLNRTFSVEVNTGKVSDQKHSGRCWLFALLNNLKHDFAKRYDVKDFELSQSYLFFWDKVERANIFFDNMIATASKPVDDREVRTYLDGPGSDGGEWAMAVALVQKYGVMPTSAFPESKVTNDTSNLNDVLNLTMRRDGKILRDMVNSGASDEDIANKRDEMLKEIFRIAGYACGVPHETFDFEYRDDNKKYHIDKGITPKEFFDKYFEVNLDDYVVIENAPNKEFNKNYINPASDNVVGGKHVGFLNMPMDVLKETAISQLKDGETIWFANDVTAQSDRKAGILDANLYHYDQLFDIDMDMTKGQKYAHLDSLSNHAMTLTGVDLVDGKPTQWKVENSWGEKVGEKGYFVMADNWMDAYVDEVIVNKKYLTDEQRQLLDQEPVVLKPWE
ncbi:C1 family peptidase [Apilactobacillus apisilvae]|uniref:Aminopeptidase n=1 Tax=Apilactobacillus apisilvae TaxID=2923364 RepID=A0ABY4PGN4_9LACO|nr:C1 family peptidase [Apilactobacillus apisilvae]UQS84737.1 C1 family peptidase [Apilactobacillus apisilvae]